MLLLLLIAPRISFADTPRAERLLQEAHRIALEAEKTSGRKPQGEKFKEAIGKYQQVLKKDADSAAGAEALLAIGKIQAGVPVDSKPPTHGVFDQQFHTDAQNEYAARETFLQILRNRKFNGKRSLKDLVDEYGTSDALRIRAVVDQAERFSDQVGMRIDAQNKKKVLYKIIDGLVVLTGKRPAFSYWFAIILLTVIVKILITPLTKAQFKSMKEMQRLQPLVKELQEKYKDDKRELGIKTMELYKEHGVNPLSGCLPLLIQMPILILVYTAIRYYEFQFAKGTFLWIGWPAFEHKFSIPIMGRPVWVTAANLAQPDLILLILYTISMIISQRLSAVDPTQADQQKMMSVMMAVMFFLIIGYLPSAFVLYWLTFNILQTWQQYHVIHGGPPITEPVTPTPAPSPGAPRGRPAGRRRRRR